MTTISGNYAAFFKWLIQDYSGNIVPTPRKNLSIKYRNEKKIECCVNYFGAQPVQKMVKILNETSLDSLQKAKVMILLSLPGDNQIFEEHEKETEILVKDTQNRITKIQFKDGSLMFEGDYTPERWRKQNKINELSNQHLHRLTDKTQFGTMSTPENETTQIALMLLALEPPKIGREEEQTHPLARLPDYRKPEECQQAATHVDHFRNLLEDLQNFFKCRRNYKLDAKLEEVKRNSADEKTSLAAIAWQIPVMIQKLCKCTKNQDGLLVSSFFEDMVASVASSRNQDVRILGKKNLGRARRASRKKMNLTVSYDDIKAAIVKFLKILAWLSSSD